MRKIINKIVCFTAAAATAIGVFSLSACGNVYNAEKLSGDIGGEVLSNGGFVVEKGNYIYYINGTETYSADNTFGNVERGAIMRISKTDLSARNYSNVQMVVPHIAYSGNYNAGIYVYGDYVYYSTPSTEKNSDGEVQNSNLAFKRTRLDGTGTMKNYFLQYSDNTVEYRYVSPDNGDTVYLMYVATSETLFGESSGKTNLHSLNTNTGEDTLLAYNVSSVTFDKQDPTNPRVFYTMNVPDFVTGSTSTFSAYNQIYTVSAETTKAPKTYDFSEVDDYDADSNPLYVNLGTLVYDGIGMIQGVTGNVTQFNGEDAANVDRPALTYTISSYENGILYYSRSSSQDTTESLYSVKQSDVLSDSWNAVTSNDSAKELIRDGSLANNYTYIYNTDGELDEVLISDSTGFIKSKVVDGKILTVNDNVNRFNIPLDGQPTVLFTQTVEADGKDVHYIYYSLTGGNGYTVNRICIDGTYEDYRRYPVTDTINDYNAIRILDLDCISDWYLPELIEGQLFFGTATTNMTSYPYVMVCDLRDDSGKIMTNAQIDELNELYNGISEDIEEIDESIYENLKDALWYAHYTGDGEYIDTLIKAYVDIMDYDEEHFWSAESVEKYKAFVAADSDGEWSKYSAVKKVNGKDVAANKLDYYYSLLGRMSSEEAESFDEYLKTTYLQSYPEKDQTWFEGLSTGAKVGFIVGVCAGGLIVIAAAAVVTLVIIRKKKSALPSYSKRRIKVDTTDDKNIDVYSNEE